MDISDLRWWGWGTLDQQCALDENPGLWALLRQELSLPDEVPESPPPSLEAIDLPPSRLDDPVLTSLHHLLGERNVRTDKRTRIEHCCGKSYQDLIRLRAGAISQPPDAVVYPADEGQVAAVLSWAASREIGVVPFGSGSDLSGGLESREDDRPTITLDLARLNRLMTLDRASWIARLQAGARGPEIETALNAKGFTLGHFPQSFEFSTLGGWIATRSAGQAATGYGKIEDLTQALRLVSPAGIIETRDASAPSSGPNLLSVLIGSRGAYGVITEATMRVRPVPEVQDYRGFLFHHLEEGIDALRSVIQRGPRPTIARLADAAETALFATVTHERNGLRSLLVDRGLETYLMWKGHSLTGGSCLLLLGYDGESDLTQKRWQQAATICQDHGGLAIGRTTGESWKRLRFQFPYLRDALVARGIMVGTIQATTVWSNLQRLYTDVTAAVRAASRVANDGPGYAMTHISQATEWGASIRTTFMGRQVPGEEIAQWQAVKQAAVEVILNAGGALSYHYDAAHRPAPVFSREMGPVGPTVLHSLKRSLDPAGIMNPGVLAPSP
jgi:alkyldihydroxyacetonephosphate synthase